VNILQIVLPIRVQGDLAAKVPSSYACDANIYRLQFIGTKAF